MLGVLEESLLMILSFWVGVYAFRKLDTFLKGLLFQIFISLIVYIGAYLICNYQEGLGLEQCNNQWLFNLYIVFETTLLTLLGVRYYVDRAYRPYFLLGLVIFFGVFIYQVFLTGIGTFANYAMITGGLLLVITYLFILFKMMSNGSIKKAPPEFWAILGLLVYFACNTPYMGVLHYIQDYSPSLNKTLYAIITEGLGSFRYVMFGLSCILILRKQSR